MLESHLGFLPPAHYIFGVVENIQRNIFVKGQLAVMAVAGGRTSWKTRLVFGLI
jgi:hypothetical protein